VSRWISPSVHLIAETQIDPVGVERMLAALGAPDWHTDAQSQAEELIEIAGKLCYMSFSTNLNKNLTAVGTRNNRDYIAKGLIGQKHGSVLEHASVTLAFLNVSRVFTHELVRHRHGSYSQTSGRYVRTDKLSGFLPSVIESDKAAEQIFESAFSMMEYFQAQLERVTRINEMGADKLSLKKALTSAFRRLLGNGQTTNIIATYNHRALRQIIEMRTSRHAEEEIRLVFAEVFDLVCDRYPAIYADAKWELVDGYPEVTFEHGRV